MTNEKRNMGTSPETSKIRNTRMKEKTFKKKETDKLEEIEIVMLKKSTVKWNQKLILF